MELHAPTHRLLIYFIWQIADRDKSLLVYIGLKWGIMQLISALIISKISLIFSVLCSARPVGYNHRSVDTTQPGKRNSKDRKGRSTPPYRRHLQTVWIFPSQNFELGSKMFSASQTFYIHFSTLENPFSKWFDRLISRYFKRLWSNIWGPGDDN